MNLPRVLLVTDRRRLPRGRDLVDTVAACVDAGLESVLLRELDLPAEERRRARRRLVRATGVTVVTARTWLGGAAGVHLAATQTGLDARPAPCHGRSCHDDAEVRRAVGGGASYADALTGRGHGVQARLRAVARRRRVRRAARLAGRCRCSPSAGSTPENAAAMRRRRRRTGWRSWERSCAPTTPPQPFGRLAEAVR